MKKISADQVRADFNDLTAVLYYTRAAHKLGLWMSERILIERFFVERTTRLLEAGCGAGRVTLGLWSLGYHNLTAFDFAQELVDQAISLAAERGADSIRFVSADATQLPADICHLMDDKHPEASSRAGRGDCHPMDDNRFGGALFMFNGLMQIPGREHRRTALRELHRVCAPGAPFLFTTHDRDHSPTERAMWRLEMQRWLHGKQDPRLIEFGDRYFEDEAGRTFMHLPNRAEIQEDLAATGWSHEFDALRSAVAKELRDVRDFSDQCRFWVANRA